MRTPLSGLVALVAVGLALTGCSSSSSGGGTPPPASPSVSPSAAANALPTIPEAFSPVLPCPSSSPAQTTLQMEGCAEHQIVSLDQQITTVAQALYASMSSADAQQLVASQTAWIAQRHAACLKVYNKYSGGSLAPVAFANCEVTKDKARLAQLQAMQGSSSP